MDPVPTVEPQLPTVDDLRAMAADLDDIDDVLTRLDADPEGDANSLDHTPVDHTPADSESPDSVGVRPHNRGLQPTELAGGPETDT